MYAASIRRALDGELMPGVIPLHLITTDRIMQRHAVTDGSGLATEEWDDSKQSRATPLDDETAYVVDRVLWACPPRSQRLLRAWYRKPYPTREIARQLGMKKRSLEKGHLVCLEFLKYRFETTRHPTLLKLLRIQV